MTNYFATLPPGVASGSLHLMRMLIQPGRYPEPHVTVRYADPPRLTSMTDAMYETARGNITLEYPTTFEPLGQGASAIDSLIVQCRSPRFESLQYKPDFFDTFLHVTLYHGQPSVLARNAYAVMTRYPWHLRFKRESVTTSKLVKYGWPTPASESEFASAVSGLARRLSLTGDMVDEMPESRRLRLVGTLCEILHESNEVVSTPHRSVFVSHSERRAPAYIQDALWLGAESKGPRRSSRDLQSEGTIQTPPEIAEQMAASALRYHDDGPIDFGDPATGTGNLYAWIERLAGAERVRTAIGIEIDQERSEATARRWARSRLEVVEADFVEWTPDRGDRSLLLANPPYVPYRRTERWAERAEALTGLARRWSLPGFGRANLYVAFVLKSHDWMRQGAVATWLLPDALMSGESAGILRRYLTSSVSLKSLHWFPAETMPVSGVRSNFVIVTFRKDAPRATDYVEYTRGDSPSHSVLSGSVPLARLGETAEVGWSRVITGGLSTHTTAGTELASGETIATFFTVRRGLATGDNRVMVLSPEVYSALGSPREFVLPVVPRARHIVGQIVAMAKEDPDAIRFGPRWLVDVKNWQLDLLDGYPAFKAYLREHHEALSQRLLVSRRREVFSVGDVPPSRFLFLSMAPSDYPRSRFFFNGLGGVALNNYLVLYPRGGARGALSADEEVRVFEALLELDYSPSTHGRELAGNLVKFEPRDLARLPVPVRISGRLREVGLG